jgi:hypothetical protein
MKKHFALNTYLLIIVSSIFMFVSSCDSSDICRENTDVPLRIGFYDINDNSVTTVIDSVSVFGLGREDSLIYDNARSVSRLELPLDSSKDTTIFIFKFPLNQDTITIINTRKITLISVGCGFATFYKVNEVYFSKNVIEEIFIQNADIRNDLNEHFKIFFPVDSIDIQ